MTLSSKFSISALFAVAALSVAPVYNTASAAEPDSCKTVRLSDVGWSDITATTAITSAILKGLGYSPKIDQLAVEVTFKSLQTKQLDVFLGYWAPSQDASIKPYLDDKSVEIVHVNLTGAKYTLAVPTYTYDKGLHDFADIVKFKDSLGGKIYGIEPGNDGNGHILDFIKSNRFGLKDFKLVESSEQGMLAEVARATKKNEDVVFLGWAPHQMNTRFKMSYLTGGDDTFGPNFGAATVSTVSRAGYTTECPNVGTFLKQETFTTDLEAVPMGWIGDDKMDPADAAKKFLKANASLLDTWLAGVTTFDGQPGAAAVKASLGL